MSSNDNPPPAAAAAASNDDALARELQAVDQLTSIFGFEYAAAKQAVDAVGTDVTVCYNYILDQGLGQDQGGPVVPIETCPHVVDHVLLTPQQLPMQPHLAPCSHSNNGAAAPVAGVARLKSDRTTDDNGTCNSTENWLCLECGVIRCSRYAHGHALVHWQETQQPSSPEGHCVAVSLADLSVWCYKCQAYLRHPRLEPLVQTLEQFKFAGDDSNAEPQQPNRKKAKSDDDAEEDVNADANEDSDASEDDDESEYDQDDNLYNMIASAIAARGIPLDFILHHAETSDEPVQYPFDTVPPTSLQDVAQFIASDACQKIVVLSGAGTSVASGIPDFRSANGLYATLDPDLLTASPAERQAIRADPTVALDQHLFLQNPLPCLELKRAFVLGTRAQQWKATLAHRFVELLHAKTGKLARLYTQNIDGLEDQCTQLPRDKVICVHGSMDRAECATCGTESDFGAFCEAVQRQIKDLSGHDPMAPTESTPIDCNNCGSPTMKPAIVLFKSSLPRVFFDSVPSDVEDVDLLIVMGTSLRVAPANSLVWRVPKSAMRVLVNREEAGMQLGMDFDESQRDFHAQGDCDRVLLDLMELLGWLDDLAPLCTSETEPLLPESSAQLLRERLARRERTEGSPEE